MRSILSTLALLAVSATAAAQPAGPGAALKPAKLWFAPDQPLTVEVKGGGQESTLVLTDFAGKPRDAKGSADVAADKTVNLKDVFQEVSQPGTYVLYLVKKGAAKDLQGPPGDFIGTPLVISVRADKRRQDANPGPMVTRIEPLRYAVMRTAPGPVTMLFYYDMAPNTVSNFLTLSEEGFYDGLTFHRIVPGFVIQGGDPTGTGTGSPGYTIIGEFNPRPHMRGVLSMARNGDPRENAQRPPAPQFANSASSQFFVCLDYAQTRQLDNRYTSFGEVTDGMAAVDKIAGAKLADAQAGRPAEPQVIEKIEVKPVTAQENPYPKLFKPGAAPAK
jgi:peptidyl-prolyl cis-trans isomerase B (cyclophilin B)